MGTFSIGGLATGLDTSSIIEQLLAIDSRPKVKLEWNRSLWEARKTGWSDLNTRLNSLQGYANTLMNPSTWTVFTGISATDPTKVAGTSAGTKPAGGDYDIEINQLATTEQWAASSALAAPTAGVRTTGIWYETTNDPLDPTDNLTKTRRNNTTTSAGINNNSTITLNWERDGELYTSTFVVTTGAKLQALMSWAETQTGATFTQNANGSWDVTSQPGTENEVTSLFFTARNAAGNVLNQFAGSPGAQTSASVVASDGGVTTADTLQITQGTQTWYVSVAAGDDVYDIVNKINATPGIGVTASESGGLLSLSATESGAASSFTVTSSGSLVADLGLAESTAGQDSDFTVNGTSYQRSTNTGITDVITDVSLDLLAVTAGPVTLTVGDAPATVDEMKQKIMDFVNQYNEIIDFVGAKTGESKVVNPDTLAEYLQGPLSRDYRFSSIAFDLRKQAGDVVSGLPGGMQMLADIGITTGAWGSANTSGKLVVDEAKLESALNSDVQGVQDIFSMVGSGPIEEDGIARRISNMVSQWRVGGTVDNALQGASSQIDTLQDSIDRFTDRLERKRSYYETMFSRLETSISSIQTQNQWLSGQLSAMSLNLL